MREFPSEDDAAPIEDADAFLDRLITLGLITAEDKELITATTIRDIQIKNLSHNRQDYERLKKRRQRIFAQIRKYLLNASD